MTFSPDCSRHIDTDKVFLSLYNNKLKRLEIELSMTKCFLKRVWLKLDIKEIKKDIKRLNKEILINKMMEEMK
jgi:hypothetical protein